MCTAVDHGRETLHFNVQYLLFRDDGDCKHVVALFFSLTLWPERHVDRNTETGTERKRKWVVPRKESKP